MQREVNKEMHMTGWRKSIPEARDRMQSKMLAGGIAAVLAGLCIEMALWVVVHGCGKRALAAAALAVSAVFVFAVMRLRAATPGGAVCGGMICLLLTFWTGMDSNSVVRSGLTPLVLLFVVTFAATRAGRQKKARAGLAEPKRGRDAAQVIANLSVAGMCASPVAAKVLGWAMTNWHWMGVAWLSSAAIWITRTMCLAALVEATADTVSSEIGQAFGGEPVMLTTLRRVAPGTDGAVTGLGSLAGVIAGVAVMVVGGWAMRFPWPVAFVAGVAGICGLFFDSLMGATVERRGWLGNDLVNYSSTAFAALLAAIGCWLVGLAALGGG